MKLGYRTFGVLGFATLALGMTALPSGCTITTSDSGLDGGNFTGNDSGTNTDTGTVDPARACNECAYQPCKAQFAVCMGNDECQAIYQCAIKPNCVNSGACVQACYDARPQGQAAYTALSSCNQRAVCGSCTSLCKPTTEYCAAIPDAGGTPDSGGGTDAGTDSGTAPLDCNTCQSTRCPTETAACAPNSKCDEYQLCLTECADEACVDQCGTNNAEGKAASAALGTCALAQCKAECNY
jgi:hypothetical protein